MRNLNYLNEHRLEHPIAGMGDHHNGVFQLAYPESAGPYLRIIASDGEGWDHVSVSTSIRPPSWNEMSYVRDLFFGDDECAFQYHPAKKDHINCHPYCLHLWHPQNVQIPMPPKDMIA